MDISVCINVSMLFVVRITPFKSEIYLHIIDPEEKRAHDAKPFKVFT